MYKWNFDVKLMLKHIVVEIQQSEERQEDKRKNHSSSG